MPSDEPFFTVPPSAKSTRRWYQRWWGKTLIAFALLLFVLIVALAFYVGRVAFLLRSGQLTPEQLLNQSGSISRSGTVQTFATSDDPSAGRSDAPVVIVEFSDFQCPFCRQSAPVVKEILKNYPDEVFFVYRDFPVPSLHPQAVIAALAGECANEQGKFWPMHDRIFERQEELSETNLKIWAVQLGLNSFEFSSCLDSQNYLAEVEQDVQEGIAAGVRATPTFFVNGVRVEGALPYNTFEQIIRAALAQ